MEGSATQVALSELDRVYSFIYSRVGNRADAEDLTQQVALKALRRLHDSYPEPSVRGYLYTTARSAMASFWSHRSRVPEAELADDLWIDGSGAELTCPPDAAEWLARTLNALPGNYRRVLELRFLRGYSLQEAAGEMGKTVGGIKVMQLRALRAAAKVKPMQASGSAGRSLRSRLGREGAPGSPCVIEPEARAG